MPLETTAALRVDLLDPGAPQIIHAVQDDSDSRKIAFSIHAGGAQWAVPAGTLVTVRYKKPDGTAGFYDTLPDGSTPAATIDGNVVTVALVLQAFTVRGNVPVQIKLYNSAGASIATFAIVMHVSANVVSDAEIVSSDYYNVLTKQIADVLAAAEGIEGNVTAAQAAAEQAASSASAAAGSATAAAGSADTASTAAGQAQTAATNAGQSEANAANSASDAEDAKTAAETAAGSASDDAAAAANAKTAAETAAMNAEAAAKALEAFGDPVTIEHGGTDANTPTQARRNLGFKLDTLYTGSAGGNVTLECENGYGDYDYYLIISSLADAENPCASIIIPKMLVAADDTGFAYVLSTSESARLFKIYASPESGTLYVKFFSKQGNGGGSTITRIFGFV